MKTWKWLCWALLTAVLLPGCGEKRETEKLPEEPPPVTDEQLAEPQPQEEQTVGSGAEASQEEDRLLRAEEITVCEGLSGRLELYGKKMNDYHWGVRYGTWTPEGAEEPACTFTAQEAIEAVDAGWGLETGENEWEYYTEAWEEDCGLVLEDFNFDGYMDFALQAATPAYNWPHYYWLYNPETGQFTYAYYHAGLAEVLPEQKLLVCEHHATPEYYTSYWAYDETGTLYLAHRNTMTYSDPMTSSNEYHGAAVQQLTAAEVAAFAAWFNQAEHIDLLRDKGQEDTDIQSYDFTDGCRFLDGSVMLYYRISGPLSMEWNWPMHALVKADGDGGWQTQRVYPDGSY